MGNYALERSSLFQLNALIWATLPQPPTAPVKPVLRNLGYRLFSIEQPLEASIGQRESIQARNPPVGVAPVADVLLEFVGSSHFIVIECKASSFGVASDQTRQARGLILASCDIVQRGLPITTGSAEVCYVVPGDDNNAMESTLLSLQAELQKTATQPCQVGAVGVTVRDDGIFLVADCKAQGGGRLPRDIAPKQRVLETEPDEDPQPLYVIPWIPESRDEDLSALREKLRSQLLSHIGRSAVGSMSLRFDDLLNEVSRNVYGLWRDRQSLQGHINPTVGSIVRSLIDGYDSVNVGSSEVDLSLASEEDRQELMECIRVADVPESLPEGHQLALEDT